ncbi:hypothetical protein PK35_09130 [Tamlana nanhaiensis]|uniref:SnoaL-like domain-containing protein n=1 Tax=Neotamlana nanhaiensis TaxID=1382798 RepID=A0A0D7W231_9FLAO|nr:hypothetical protein [Tamlana nanhaiensis]KJD33109.1 hypothetical protein PK35_09130 [Tamlana nanhaiensis]
MKKLLFILFLGIFSTTSFAQEEPEDISLTYPEKVTTVESTIQTLYRVISGEKDQERDWKLFKFLFKPDAKLIPTLKDKDDKLTVRYMSPSDYIKSSGDWMVRNGFIEREIHREVHVFGHIAQVFSTYECYESLSDEKPFMRGINSIQLFNDDERWWITNIQWSQESAKYQIPSKYLR